LEGADKDAVTLIDARPDAVGRTVADLAWEPGLLRSIKLDWSLSYGFDTRFSLPLATPDPTVVAPPLQAGLAPTSGCLTRHGSGRLRRGRDLSGGGERFLADSATGVRHVIVNGTPVPVVGSEVDLDARPGIIPRGSR
jgi:hypothetical protein